MYKFFLFCMLCGLAFVSADILYTVHMQPPILAEDFTASWLLPLLPEFLKPSTASGFSILSFTMSLSLLMAVLLITGVNNLIRAIFTGGAASAFTVFMAVSYIPYFVNMVEASASGSFIFYNNLPIVGLSMFAAAVISFCLPSKAQQKERTVRLVDRPITFDDLDEEGNFNGKAESKG